MINVGIAGIGFMGMTHYNAYQKVRGVKVAALCEQDRKRLAGDWRSIKGNFGPQGTMMDLSGIAKYENLDGMLADPGLDLIDICLPPAAHVEATVAALKAGKHVFCEKPIALRPADAKRMVQTAEKCGKLLLIGHVLPMFPEYRFAYQAITSGKYGKLLGGHFKRIISDPQWLPDFYNPDTTGGPMLDLHVHDAHFIRLVCGMPSTVQTVGRMRGEVVELFSSQFLFNGADLVVSAQCGAINQQGRPFVHAFEIYLEKATLLYDLGGLGDAPAVPLTVLTADGKKKQPKLGSGDAFELEIKEVVKSVQTGAPSALLDGILARDAVILCEKQTDSARKGKPVKV